MTDTSAIGPKDSHDVTLHTIGPSISMGMGKTMVEPFSAAMVLRVWRYRSCRAVGDLWMASAASFSAREAFSSP